MAPIKGTTEELQFWERFAKTDRFLHGWVSKTKTPELQQIVADFILNHPHNKILDCGSGVVSILNGLCDGELVSTDLLGDEYQNLFDYQVHELKPPLPIAAENLPFNNKFDIVHMSNALDHTQNPVKAYKRLYDACKPGGYVIIQGFENEATYENWQGMHQWNIYVKDNRLYCDGKSELFLLADDPVICETVTFENKKSWFIWITQR